MTLELDIAGRFVSATDRAAARRRLPATSDVDLRVALLRKLTAPAGAPMVIEEMAIAGEARVDVATIGDHLRGFEIKSERDTLRRLPSQIRVYSRVFDYVTLVVSDRHAEQAKGIIPEWWGVLEARRTRSGVALTRRVRPRKNRHVDPWYLTSLLWRDEALRVLTDRGLDRGMRSKNGLQLREALVESVPTSALRAAVRESLRLRRDWRPATP
ncbi:sce7726 family protein [Curtobacterium sp. RHCJP20]|uniref:Sce7726 family protein n=1 Tax=Curtobacterium subtropicum TaxID=3055138 RepID=A0ABT7TDR5_9MICO|nr:sce7726 family protein [Curtobacterium subtropicum]MDM7887701.1 sce7726 family protein [Curtobacterium subtropicum]